MLAMEVGANANRLDAHDWGEVDGGIRRLTGGDIGP